MNLASTISIYGGGPGSGCNPEVGKCGRKPGSTSGQSDEAFNSLANQEKLKKWSFHKVFSFGDTVYHGTDENGANAVRTGEFSPEARIFDFEPFGVFTTTSRKLAEFYARQRARAFKTHPVLLTGKSSSGIVWKRDTANIILKPSDFQVTREEKL